MKFDVLDKTKEFNNSQVVVKSGDKNAAKEKLHFFSLLKQAWKPDKRVRG